MFGLFQKFSYFLFGDIEPLEKCCIPQEVKRIEKEVRDIAPLERRQFLLLEFYTLHQRLRSRQVCFYYSVREFSEQQIGGTSDVKVTLITGHHSVVIAIWQDGKVLKTHSKDGTINLNRGTWRSLVD